jgi:hypothetical protein
MQTLTMERQVLQRVIDILPDDSILALLKIVRSLRSHAETVEWVDLVEVGTLNVGHA